VTHRQMTPKNLVTTFDPSVQRPTPGSFLTFGSNDVTKFFGVI